MLVLACEYRITNTTENLHVKKHVKNIIAMFSLFHW